MRIPFFSGIFIPWRDFHGAKLPWKLVYHDILVSYGKSSCNSLLLTLDTHPWGTTKNIKRKLKMWIKNIRKLVFNPNTPQAKLKPVISQIWKFRATAGHSAVLRGKVINPFMTLNHSRYMKKSVGRKINRQTPLLWTQGSKQGRVRLLKRQLSVLPVQPVPEAKT